MHTVIFGDYSLIFFGAAEKERCFVVTFPRRMIIFSRETKFVARAVGKKKIVVKVAECEFFLSKSPRLACFPPFSFSCSAVLIKKSASLSERFFLFSSHGELSSAASPGRYMFTKKRCRQILPGVTARCVYTASTTPLPSGSLSPGRPSA